MKKILIRKGVFETNSSSAHSVSIADDTKQFVLDTIYPDQNGEILLEGGEFGWEWFKANDALTKANYAAQSFSENEGNMQLLVDVIKEQTGATDVLYDLENGYVDHDSYGVCPSNHEDLKNFIFNKNSWLFGGNDNTMAEPTFYDVPVYKDGHVVNPEYKYELFITDYDKTIKFIDEPNDEKIIEGLQSLLQYVYLYENGDGNFFNDDRSLLGQISRQDGSFKFSSYEHKMTIDLRKNKIPFIKNAWNDAMAEYTKENPNYTQEEWSKSGYKKTSLIEKKLLKQKNSPYVRWVSFSIKKYEKKGKKVN